MYIQVCAYECVHTTVYIRVCTYGRVCWCMRAYGDVCFGVCCGYVRISTFVCVCVRVCAISQAYLPITSLLSHRHPHLEPIHYLTGILTHHQSAISRASLLATNPLSHSRIWIFALLYFIFLHSLRRQVCASRAVEILTNTYQYSPILTNTHQHSLILTKSEPVYWVYYIYLYIV